MRHRYASSSECPRHHQRELFSPECATVRSSSLIHEYIRICIAQCVRPPPCVLKEERLLCAGDKVCARKRARHNARRVVTTARRGRRRPHRRHLDAEAQERGPTLHPPRRRTLGYVQCAAPCQTATASIGERPRRRTSRVPQNAPAQSPVSTHGAVAYHRSAHVHRRSSWTVRRPSRATGPTSRFADRHRRRRLLRAGPVERTP